jgi:putative transposase
MKSYKAYKVRLYPNKVQEELMNKTFGATRYIWNNVLSYRKDLYAYNKTSYSRNESIKVITEIKHIEGYEWLNEIDTVSLQRVKNKYLLIK